jgi:rubrerythrin
MSPFFTKQLTRKRKQSISHLMEDDMNLNDRLFNRYMHRLFSTPQGRAHVLVQCAEAEDSDEGQIFEGLMNHVDDDRLHRMIRRHAADEKRHAEMFRQRVRATGVEPPEVPDYLRLIDRLDAELGHFLERDFANTRDIMEAYLLLQVIEERAITQFKMFEPIMREYDPEAADVLVAIAKDEERHLKYCHAISKQYAPSEAIRQITLKRFREVEARCFTDNTLANMTYVLDNNLLSIGRLETVFWRTVAALTKVLGPLDKTPYFDEQEADGAQVCLDQMPPQRAQPQTVWWRVSGLTGDGWAKR